MKDQQSEQAERSTFGMQQYTVNTILTQLKTEIRSWHQTQVAQRKHRYMYQNSLYISSMLEKSRKLNRMLMFQKIQFISSTWSLVMLKKFNAFINEGITDPKKYDSWLNKNDNHHQPDLEHRDE